MRRLVAALLLTIAGSAQGEVQVLEQAEIGSSHVLWGVIPNEKGTWTAVSLPHNWYRDPPLGTWYRMRFHLDSEPWGGLSLYFPKVQLGRLEVYVNRESIWKLTDHYAEGVGLSGVKIPIPSSLLRSGENTIHLGTYGSGRWHHGVSRVYLGDNPTLTKRVAVRRLLQDEIRYVVPAAFGALGILCLWLWLRVVRDPVLFWYGVSAVTLLVATAAWYAAQWQSDAGWRVAMIFMRYHGYLVPFFILHLRLAGRKDLWLESALWVVLISALVTQSKLDSTAWVSWSLAFAVAPALLTVPLLMSSRLRRRPSVILLVIADFAACLLPLHDWAWRFGYLDFDRPHLTYFAPFFVMLAAAVPITERVQAGLRAREQSRQELERRVAEKAHEIEASHEKLRQVQREQVLAEERRRIMADMHDGMGARLVALLSVAQSGKARHGEISEGIAAALDELRLAVDSVQPVEGDVGVVLGNVRHRMRSVFERAGVQLNWKVSELPRMDDLTPERILAIQRIVLETFSNAIRHAGARSVAVFTLRVPGAVRIVIEDDGCGFDPTAAKAGTGLANLQLRAAQAGGTLAVASQAGKGARVTLTLPLVGDELPEPLPGSGQEADDYPVRGISPDAASS